MPSPPPTPLNPGHFYHIYNRGNNRENLFRENGNYEYFLRLYEKHIDPVAKTYAWVLMGNHFHLLVRMKEVGELLNLSGFGNLTGLEVSNKLSKQFSNLFNAYTKAYNKKFNRTGALFQRTFRRLEITGEEHLRSIIIYIHKNPLRHGFTDDYKTYPWSSYGSIISIKPTRLKRDEVLGWFDEKANFIEMHDNTQNKEFDPHPSLPPSSFIPHT
jgi:REP element-mobilizing transposase RayT